MANLRGGFRAVLLSLSMLSACAASDPSRGDAMQSGVLGNYLAGRFALSEGDSATASRDLLKALAARPTDQELMEQAFVATLLAGRPEAAKLAARLPNNQFSRLVLANGDIRAGRWSAAEQQFRKLPRQGLSQVLQPLLVAWAQLGDGHPDSALSTLQPYVEDPRFRTLFVANAALIADLGNRRDEAGKLYHALETTMAEPNLRLTQILASWQARTGQPVDAQRSLASLAKVATDTSIALPGLLANVTKRVVTKPSDGVAETYFTFAAMLRAQDMNDPALIMLRMALDLRPEFAAARLLMADLMASQHHPAMALAALSDVSSADPMYPVIELRRATLLNMLGRTDESMKVLQRLSEEFASSPLPDTARGDMLRAKKQFPEAVQAYDKAISRVSDPAPNDWVLFYSRGVAEDQARQWARAEADLKRALGLSPNQPFVLNYLGYSWADRGENLAKAKQMIQAAAQARPNDGAITDSLGWIQFRQGDAAGAVKTLERAVELEPEDPTINAHLGDAYAAVGRKIEAQYQWRRALTLSPTPDDAAKLEAKLNTGHPGPVLSGQ